MRVTVLYFAAARERAGADRDTIELPDGATAADAVAKASALRPGVAAIAQHLRVAVDKTFAKLDQRLSDGAEVALIPPVSGGR